MSVMMQKLHPSATPGANSVMSPDGVMRAILAGAPVKSVPSVNQRLRSEPLVMARGWLLAVGTLNCFSPATGAATAVLPSASARPAASAVAIARPNRLVMIPPLELTAGLQRPLVRSTGNWANGFRLEEDLPVLVSARQA